MPVGGLIPLTSFSPDLDPLTPGVITDANDFVPTLVGFRSLPDLTSVSQALPSKCRGAAAITFADGDQWVVAGCCDDAGGSVSLNTVRSADLDEMNPPAWLTQGIVPGTAPGRWRFDVFQNPNVGSEKQEIIAVDGVHHPLSATRERLEFDLRNGTNQAWEFLDGGPPIASHVAASDFYLFLVGELEADILHEDWPTPIVTNHWWASDHSNQWDLVIAADHISVDGRLGQTSGPITAMLALRSTMIAYKSAACYIGQLQQPPSIWTFTEASRQTGAQGQEGVIAIRDMHNFVGPDDFFTLDGFSIAAIPNSLRRWFTFRVNRMQRNAVQARFDADRSIVFLHFPSEGDTDNDSLELNEWIAFNFVTQQWSCGKLDIRNVVAQTIRHEDDSCPGVILNDETLAIYMHDSTRTQPGAFLVTGDLGDRRNLYETQPIRPGFTLLNGTPTLTGLSTYVSGRPYTTGNTVPLTADGWFNLQLMGRMLRLRIDADAEVEIASLDVPMQPMGDA